MEIFGGGSARNGLGVENHNAVVGCAQANLVLGTNHSLGGLTAQLGFLDGERLVALIKGGADGGHHHLLASGHVGGAAHDVERLLPAHVHRGHVQMIGVGMGLAGKHFANDQALQPATHGLERLRSFNLQSTIRQVNTGFLGRQIECQQFFQPFVRNLHILYS